MRYIVSSLGSIETTLSKILIEEVKRFDIRAEAIEVNSGKREVISKLRSDSNDVLIVIGSKKSFPVVQLGSRKHIPTFFFYQSLLEKKPSEKKIEFEGVKVFEDASSNQGSLLGDFIKKVNLKGVSSFDERATHVTILCTNPTRNTETLRKRLSSENSNIRFQSICASDNLEDVVKALRKSNMMIAMDQFSSMVAVMTNCPQISVYQPSMFKRSNNRFSITHKILEKKVIHSCSIHKIDMITSEMDRILNDHQYCAGILEDYQQIKSILGTSPFARSAAQKIVEQLENHN